MPRFAICSTVKWNTLTPAEQLEYDTYYTAVKLGFDVMTETPSENYDLTVLEGVDIGGQVTTPADLNGKSINLYGGGFVLNDDYVVSTFHVKHSNGTLNVWGCLINKTEVASSSVNRHLFFFKDHGTGNTNIFNNTYDMNESVYGVARIHQHNTGAVKVYANIFRNSTITAASCINNSHTGDGAYSIVNNDFINVSKIVEGNATGSSILMRNNYIDFTDSKFTGNVVDGGGNVDQNTTSVGDAFYDMVDYVPKSALRVGVYPDLEGFTSYKNGVRVVSPYYTGALGVQGGGGGGAGKRKKLKIMLIDD